MNYSVDFGLLAKAAGETRKLMAGETIFSAGDPAGELYVVKEGEVEIVVRGKAVETVPTGGVFGEMALIDASPRSADARAKTDVTLVPVSEKQFLFMISEAPYFALSVMRLLAQRLRAANASA